MNDAKLLPGQHRITFFELDFPDLKQAMPVAIDETSGDVFVSPIFFPGGHSRAMGRASEYGEPMLQLKQGFLIRAAFVERMQRKQSILRAVGKIVDHVRRALEESRKLAGSPDENETALVGPDAGRVVH